MKTSYPCSLNATVGNKILLVCFIVALSALINTLSAQVLPINNGANLTAARNKNLFSELNIVQVNASGNATDSLHFATPGNWVTREVVIDIYNSKGKLVRKITEHAASSNLAVEVFDLKAGAYVFRLSCRNEIALHHTVRFATL